ncbi:enolase [Salmonella phage 41]|nr:enolase [Salmonella phage 41]
MLIKCDGLPSSSRGGADGVCTVQPRVLRTEAKHVVIAQAEQWKK